MADSLSLLSQLWGRHLVLDHRRFCLHISTEHRIECTKHTNDVATTPTEQKNIHHVTVCTCSNVQRSQYSDSLRAGRFGDRIRLWARFFAPVQTCPRAHPASYTMGNGYFPGVKRPGRGVDHPHAYNAEAKGKVKLFFYTPCGTSRPVIG